MWYFAYGSNLNSRAVGEWCRHFGYKPPALKPGRAAILDNYRLGFPIFSEYWGGGIADIVYDPIGAQVTDESLRSLAWGGRLLILGFLGGGPTNIRSNYLLIKGIDAIGVRIGGLNEADPALAVANMKSLVQLAADGMLRPHISYRFPLAEAAKALQVVIDRKAIGKVVLVT